MPPAASCLGRSSTTPGTGDGRRYFNRAISCGVPFLNGRPRCVLARSISPTRSPWPSWPDGYGVMAAYTTSQPWAGALPQGVIAFDSAEAASLGQARAFVLDLRRLAYLPLTTAWFPHAGEEGAGVLGRAPKALRDRVNAMATDLVKRRPEALSRSGPLWGPAA